MKMPTRLVSRYWQVVAPFRGAILLLLALSIFTTGVRLLQPFLFQYIIDEIALKEGLTRPERLRGLARLTILMAVLTSMSFVTGYWHSYRSSVLTHKFMASLRFRLLRHMLHLPLNELTKMRTGGAVARLNQDTATVSQIVHRSFLTPVLAVMQGVVALGMVFFLNWQMSLAALIVIAPIGAVTHLLGKRLRPMFTDINALGSELAARAHETFSGIRVARLYRREVAERRAYFKTYHRVIRKTLQARRSQIVIDTMWAMTFGITQIVIVTVGVYLIIYDRATVGAIVAIIIYANRIMGPIDQVVQSYDRLQEDLAAMDRIFGVLDLEQDKLDRPDAVEAPRKVERLALSHVGFSYDGHAKALSDIDFTVRGGQTVALVGRSGAGKSTLIDLLSRFYDPQEGAILLNGRDLRDLRLKSYRGLIGMVQQDVFLFDGTARDNIAYAAPRASMAEIVAAATRANAHEFLAQLPLGYETVIGERGVRLSGGQRQRLSIARAFLVDPEILIMDEATSNLDTENEQAIQAALKELVKNRTTFIIAHRLSTVTHADMIVVLDQGRVCEIGTHDTLMAQRGHYFEMIERQRSAIIFEPTTQLVGASRA
jgi:ATP-binding cassette, subfamily B, bacterial